MRYLGQGRGGDTPVTLLKKGGSSTCLGVMVKITVRLTKYTSLTLVGIQQKKNFILFFPKIIGFSSFLLPFYIYIEILSNRGFGILGKVGVFFYYVPC